MKCKLKLQMIILACKYRMSNFRVMVDEYTLGEYLNSTQGTEACTHALEKILIYYFLKLCLFTQTHCSLHKDSNENLNSKNYLDYSIKVGQPSLPP